jgi:hypothetical protein
MACALLLAPLAWWADRRMPDTTPTVYAAFLGLLILAAVLTWATLRR